MLKGSGIRVNLLPYHRFRDDNNVSSSGERMMYFKHNLVDVGDISINKEIEGCRYFSCMRSAGIRTFSAEER